MEDQDSVASAMAGNYRDMDLRTKKISHDSSILLGKGLANLIGNTSDSSFIVITSSRLV